MKFLAPRKLLALLALSTGLTPWKRVVLSIFAALLLLTHQPSSADGIDWVYTPGFPGESTSFNRWEPFGTGYDVAVSRFETWESLNCGPAYYYVSCSMLGPTPFFACQQYISNATCLYAENIQPYVHTNDVYNGPVSAYFRYESWQCNTGFHLTSTPTCVNAYFIRPPPPKKGTDLFISLVDLQSTALQPKAAHATCRSRGCTRLPSPCGPARP